MATCPACKVSYGADVHVCPADGEALLPDEAFRGSDQDLAAGHKVGEYTIDAKIGEGGFGAVYRASHPLIGKRVAIKVLYRQFSSNPQMVSRFIDEARAVNQIRHRCIIDIFSFGQLDDGRHYYVMELLTGQALDKLLIERGRLPLGEALPILRQLARALDAVHQQGIAHRDLKPENIFVCTDDDGVYPKLLDFGIAKLSVQRPDAHKTRTGAPLGTPYYMSPEQCRGKYVDHRTDIYSFGVVTYRVLTGKLPFDGDDFMEIMLQQLNFTPPRPSKVVRGLPEELDKPLMWMLEKEVDRRPPSLVAAVRALEEAGAAAGIVAVPAPLREVESRRAVTGPIGGARPARTPSTVETATTLSHDKAGSPNVSFIAAEAANLERPRRARWLLAGLGLLAVVGAAAAGVVLTRREGRPPPVRAAAPAHAPAPAPAPAPVATVAPSRADAAAPATVVLEVQAKPPGAEVLLDGTLLGTAPGRFEIAQRREPAVLEVRLDDHESYRSEVTPAKDMVIAVSLERRHRPSAAPPRPTPRPPAPTVERLTPAAQPPPPPPEPPKPPKPDRESIENPQWDK